MKSLRERVIGLEAHTVEKVDVVKALTEGRDRMSRGEKIEPKQLTPEQVAKFQRTELGRSILAARRRVGWGQP